MHSIWQLLFGSDFPQVFSYAMHLIISMYTPYTLHAHSPCLGCAMHHHPINGLTQSVSNTTVMATSAFINIVAVACRRLLQHHYKPLRVRHHCPEYVCLTKWWVFSLSSIMLNDRLTDSLSCISFEWGVPPISGAIPPCGIVMEIVSKFSPTVLLVVVDFFHCQS